MKICSFICEGLFAFKSHSSFINIKDWGTSFSFEMMLLSIEGRIFTRKSNGTAIVIHLSESNSIL